ncbi:cell division protein ZapB [Succinimonas amylolytica]|uniref:cell division protein ZapB n=1 Tax=Succinimonas amylolytica TaxID=83769 RepID=UPI000367E758|nr:cell division protein ZapB [Succinimonas amylolytica]
MNTGEINEFFDMLEGRITALQTSEKERDELRETVKKLSEEKSALESELSESRSENLRIMENQKNWTERVRSLLSRMEAP